MGSQQGQAIVLIAIMLAVVVGMAALAVDGSLPATTSSRRTAIPARNRLPPPFSAAT
jgi:hypothetical protein